LVEYTVEVVYGVVWCPPLWEVADDDGVVTIPLLLDVTDGVETTPLLDSLDDGVVTTPLLVDDPDGDCVGVTLVLF
jgi:hypothetical protein